MENSENLKAKKSMQLVWIAKSFILLASFLSMLFSIFLFYSNETERGIFVGLWVPSILSAGALLFAGRYEH
jgi:hypothetical protein